MVNAASMQQIIQTMGKLRVASSACNVLLHGHPSSLSGDINLSPFLHSLLPAITPPFFYISSSPFHLLPNPSYPQLPAPPSFPCCVPHFSLPSHPPPHFPSLFRFAPARPSASRRERRMRCFGSSLTLTLASCHAHLACSHSPEAIRAGLLSW